MSKLRTLRTERSLTAVYKAVVVLHFWFVTSCRWESELETWRSSLLRPGFLIQPDMMPYLCFDKTIQPQAASNSTLLHASSSMIYSQAFKLHKNNSWSTQPRKKALTFCCWWCLLYTVEPAVSLKRYYLYTARCHGNDSRPRCLYMWTGGEKKKTKMGGKTERSIHW